MALVPDYNPDEEESAADRVGAGPRASSMVGGAAPSSSVSPSSQTRSPMSGGDEFTPWSSFVSANREVSQREAGKLKSGVQGQVNSAIEGRENASAAQAAGVADNYNIKNDEGGASFSAFGGTSFGGNEPAKAPAQGASTFTRELKDTQADGAANLEEQVGAPAWSALIGQTANAQAQAKSLGSEGGVQALLGKTKGPASAFDAALVGGAGGKDFRDLSKQYGGTQLSDNLLSANQSAVNRWQGLLGDIDKAKDAQGVANAPLANPDAAAADVERTKTQMNEHLGYLNQNFPTLAQAKDKDTLLAWMNANSKGTGAAHSQQASWANSIYGPEVSKQLGSQGAVTKFYQDIQKMTPEEFAMFAQGFVPPWMGLGQGAMGVNGGFWWGFRNSNEQVGAGGPGDPSKLSPEKRKEYETAMKALGIFYQVLAAVATGAATAAGGPVAGAAVGAATSAGLGAQNAATGTGY